MSGLRRRGLLGGVAALAPAVALGSTANKGLDAAAPPYNSDAELIARCRAFIAATTAYDAEGGRTVDEEQDPLWRRWSATLRALDGLQATTVAGVAAKAEVALFLSRQPDGSEEFSTSYTGDWPEQVVRDLLRVAEGQA